MTAPQSHYRLGGTDAGWMFGVPGVVLVDYWVPRGYVQCPDAPVCRVCPAATDDDVCFPGDRARAEREARP